MSAPVIIREAQRSNDAIVGLLRRATSGADGGIRIRDDAPDVERISDATWLTAWRGDRIVGTYALVERPWGWWRCCFAVDPDEDARVVGGHLVEEAKVRITERLRPGQVIAGSHDETNHLLHDLLHEAGYEPIARFELIVWSRRRAHPRVGPIEPAELDIVHEYLRTRGVHWSDAEQTLRPEQFLVLRDADGGVRAGAQCCPMTWTIESLGPGSWVTMPVLRTLGVSLAPLEWASVHHCFGSIEDLACVWSAALARLKIRAALVGIDAVDSRALSWRTCARGTVGRIVGVSTTLVTATAAAPGPLDWSPVFAT